MKLHAVPTRNLWFGAVAAVGAGLFAYSRMLPVYTDPERAAKLKIDACTDSGVRPGWSAELMSLETLRHPLMQGGSSLVLAAATLWFVYRIYGRQNGWRLTSPSSKSAFFAIGIGVIGLSFASQMYSLDLDFRRGAFPWCADSMAIPIFGLVIVYSVLTVACLFAGAIASMGIVRVPVSLFAWPRNDSVFRTWAITILAAVIAVPIAAVGILEASNSSFIGTPAAILALYLIESTRSALVSREADAS